MRKTLSSLILLLPVLFANAALAQVPNGNVFFGYSYMSADLSSRTNLNGWNASLEGKVLPFIGLVADLTGDYGSQTIPPPFSVSANIGEHTFLFGPRASFPVGKFRPFVHGLVGVGHISESGTGYSNSDTSLSYALGGGIDYHLAPRISWRVQADSLQTRFFGSTQNNVRISTGIAVHF
jgi:opacity protein-like surface antigen